VTILVVNAQHVHGLPGRKTDAGDAEWLGALLRHGLLRPSSVPPRWQRELRELVRFRRNLVHRRAQVANELQKTLELANIKLASVVSDITGVSATEMLQHIVAGTGTPESLSELGRGALRKKKEALTRALTGRIRDHYRFILSQQLGELSSLEEDILAISEDPSRPVGTGGHDALAVGRVGHRVYMSKVPSKDLHVQVRLSLPVVPFKSMIGKGAGVLQHLLHPAKIIVLPRLPGEVDVGGVAVVLRVDLLRFGLEARLFFGTLRFFGFLFRRQGFVAFILGSKALASRFDRLPTAHADSQDQGHRHGGSGGKRDLVPPKGFLKTIQLAGGSCHDRLIRQMALNILEEPVRRVIAAGAVLFQALHHDPVQIPAQKSDRLSGLNASAGRHEILRFRGSFSRG